ncbi:LysM peptidoglycan-binding domain-containing protein [Francisella tularensis]|uniref:LysM peptidoglycan-binding domain-containing protein n=3 Tax=Francisella tularensis TaxID=263 RepID=UPI000173E597|nr:LysM peptidoglycan-binding domain-containing protein [Francisella tularensis]ACD30269.1 type IV pili, pilus assembly protein [Francisella tularensis subsp. mediasiatica FSC147]MBK2078615.1 LysM peptidoglycan-binding domain-containing protein [Francisella tularensis subsp. mediasiatica]MBK2102043.1 LysM peptidoglycan-binding domain-containing protein [Francisella tularensis subsp. mediasiatica]MBK2104133.1 LysM peptidoglycan-binding domain-containing protein [Francisella tularensis subsp. med
MLKSISRVLVAGFALAMVSPVFSMEIYTVKSNDYLYKIAKNHAVTGVSISELTDAIKGINKSEIPGIIDNRIRIGDKLAIPTTKAEVEDGLTLMRNQIIQSSYQQPSSDTTSQQPSSTPAANLGDNTAAANDADDSSTPSVVSQDKIPVLIPTDDNSTPETYKSNLDTQINSDNIQETASYEQQPTQSSSTWGSLFRFIIYVIILAVVVVVGKRFWETRNSKKEQELELISKKKRDHLMSRISPVVSDNEFYRSDKVNNSPQEEFDFFGAAKSSRSEVTTVDEEIQSQQESEDTFEQPAQNEEDLFAQRDKNIIVKTEKGVVFETNTDDTLVNSTADETKVEEIDSQQQAEQELQYINELIEQFLDSEKYVEASITIQDSLEKDPNNIDLRYKLLEVYARAGDEIAFEGEVHFIKSKNIVSMFDPLHQKIAKLRDKYFE